VPEVLSLASLAETPEMIAFCFIASKNVLAISIKWRETKSYPILMVYFIGLLVIPIERRVPGGTLLILYSAPLSFAQK
jgi:hypothetical protein